MKFILNYVQEFEELIPQSPEKKVEERVDERVNNTLHKKVEAKMDGVQGSLTTRVEIIDTSLF